MQFTEFIDRCLTIQYDRNAVIGDFGSPMNCYGFVYWYYRLCRGCELDRDGVESVNDIHRVRFIETQVPTNGDIVNIRTADGVFSNHVGLFMDGVVYHFAVNGLRTKVAYRMPHLIKGYYHVIQD